MSLNFERLRDLLRLRNYFLEEYPRGYDDNKKAMLEYYGFSGEITQELIDDIETKIIVDLEYDLDLKDPENGNINMKITKDYKKLLKESILI